MKKNMSLIVGITALLALALVTASWAQPGWRGWGPKEPYGMKYGRMYDPQTVETVAGEVVNVNKYTPGRGISYGLQLNLKTEKGPLLVMLGPGWYIEKQDLKIAPGDQVEIKGSRTTYEGQPALIAAEVKKGNQVLKLRDDNGFPVWAGQRWR